jgi:hypothetical protein
MCIKYFLISVHLSNSITSDNRDPNNALNSDIIIIRNGTKTIILQTSFGDLIIRNGAKKISLQTSFGDLIRNRANTMCLLKLKGISTRLGIYIKQGW